MIAGGGFAVMAWRAAQWRIWSVRFSAPTRERAAAIDGPSRMYYAILDRATDAWEIERNCQMSGLGDPRVVRL